MHVLLIYANRPRLTYGFLPGPYGLETLRAYLDEAAVDCDIVNPFLSVDPKAQIRNAIRDDTVIVGISIRNLDDALTLWSTETANGEIQTECSIDDAKCVVDMCQSLAPGIPIVVGGAAFGHMAQPLLKYLNLEFGFSRSAEHGFSHLVSEMCNGHPFRDVVNKSPYVVGVGNQRRRVATTVLSDCNRPVIERESLYFRFRPEAAVRSFSGCPLSCAHCIEHVSSRRIVRADPSIVATEVDAIAAHYSEVKRIFLADSEVNLAGEERTRAVIGEIRGRGHVVPLAGYFNPRPLSIGLLRFLNDARCDIRLTIDHASDSVLSRNGKNFRKSHLSTLLGHYAELGIELSFSLLLGQPGETRKSVDEVLRFVDAIPERIRGPVYFSPGVRVYPGTPIHNALVGGQLDKRWLVGNICEKHPFVNPVVYCESWDPFELFEYIESKAGGAIKPMNSYLRHITRDEKVKLEEEFRDYHVGVANLGRDDDMAWLALSRVSAETPLLSLNQKIELLWARGRISLVKAMHNEALNDWLHLRSMLEAAGAKGAAVPKLEHNIRIATQMASMTHRDLRSRAELGIC